MMRRLQPTRAEVNDISNAILQGIDCCILTGETATGPHFREATSYLSKICYETELGLPYEANNLKRQSLLLKKDERMSVQDAMSNVAVNAAYMLGAQLIIIFSNTGEQAITVKQFSPNCPVLVVLASEQLAKQVMLHSGIFYMVVGSQLGRESLNDTVKKKAKERGLV